MNRTLFEGNFRALNGKQTAELIKAVAASYKSNNALTGTYVHDVDTIKAIKEFDAVSGKNKMRKVDNSKYRVEKTTVFTSTFDKSYLEYPTVKAYQQGREDAGYEKKEQNAEYTYVNDGIKTLTDAINGCGIADPSLALKLPINIDFNEGSNDSISSTYKLYEKQEDGTETVSNVDKDYLIKHEIIRDKEDSKEFKATKVLHMDLSFAKITKLEEVIPENN